jgi:hypothetical protein
LARGRTTRFYLLVRSVLWWVVGAFELDRFSFRPW